MNMDTFSFIFFLLLLFRLTTYTQQLGVFYVILSTLVSYIISYFFFFTVVPILFYAGIFAFIVFTTSFITIKVSYILAEILLFIDDGHFWLWLKSLSRSAYRLGDLRPYLQDLRDFPRHTGKQHWLYAVLLGSEHAMEERPWFCSFLAGFKSDILAVEWLLAVTSESARTFYHNSNAQQLSHSLGLSLLGYSNLQECSDPFSSVTVLSEVDTTNTTTFSSDSLFKTSYTSDPSTVASGTGTPVKGSDSTLVSRKQDEPQLLVSHLEEIKVLETSSPVSRNCSIDAVLSQAHITTHNLGTDIVIPSVHAHTFILGDGPVVVDIDAKVETLARDDSVFIRIDPVLPGDALALSRTGFDNVAAIDAEEVSGTVEAVLSCAGDDRIPADSVLTAVDAVLAVDSGDDAWVLVDIPSSSSVKDDYAEVDPVASTTITNPFSSSIEDKCVSVDSTLPTIEGDKALVPELLSSTAEDGCDVKESATPVTTPVIKHPLDGFENDRFLQNLRIDVKPVGKGGFGKVYRGLLGTHRVAVKVMENRDDGYIEREIEAMQRMQGCPWAVQLYYHQINEEANKVMMIMEYITGGTLEQRMGSFNEDTPLQDVVQIIAELYTAVHAVHRRGVIHRDIKPENVMFRKGHVVIVDFGLAKIFDHNDVDVKVYRKFIHLKTSPYLFPPLWAKNDNPHVTDNSCGTPGYMAPEVWRGELYSYGVDFFSVAATFYEILTQEHPFELDTEGVPRPDHILKNPDILTVPMLSDFFDRTLQYLPTSRASLPGIMRHPVFSEIDWKTLMDNENSGSLPKVEEPYFNYT